MIRFLFLRVIVPLLLILFIRSILRALFSSSRSVARPAAPGPMAHTGGELKKDPVCGTYVSVDASVTKQVKGETVHFCSAACRDKYRVA